MLDARAGASEAASNVAFLEVADLTVEYGRPGGGAEAVRRVSMEIAEGSVVGIVGESGCGKSTLARALGCVPAADAHIGSGIIRYRGNDLVALPERRLRRLRGQEIAMVFQDPVGALNPVMTVGKQLTETIRTHMGLGPAAARERTLQLLDFVRIPDPALRMRAYPHELSGGMCQRVGIALAISCDPHLLIADEPTTALDATVATQILDLFRKLRRELSMTIILITHNLGIISALAEYVFVMYAGRIVEEGPVRDVVLRPQHPYTRGLMQSIVRLDGKLQGRLPSMPGAPPSLTDRSNGCSFANRCDLAREICSERRPLLLPVGESSQQKAACWAGTDVWNELGVA